MFYRFFLIFCIGSMEVYAFYPLAAFFVAALSQRELPVAAVFLIFWVAGGITALLTRRRTYLILILLLEGMGWALCTALVLYLYYAGGVSFFSGWLSSLAPSSPSPEQILAVATVAIAATFAYIMGILFGKRKTSYQKVVAGMEKGIGFLFFASVLSVMTQIAVQKMEVSVLLFFFWGILAVALSRNRSWGSFKSKGKGASKMIVAFTAGICAVIVSIVFFALDYLQWAAGAGYSVLKTIAHPFMPYIIWLIRFFLGFMLGKSFSEQTAESAPEIGEGGMLPMGDSPWMRAAETIFGYLALCLVILAAVILIAYLIRLLFTKRGKDGGPIGFKQFVADLLKRIKEGFLTLFKLIGSLLRRPKQKPSRALQTYRKMQKWGAWKGVVWQKNETPLEYSGRLRDQYPGLGDSFDTISGKLCLEVYGGRLLSEDETGTLKDAWRNIARLKNHFIGLKTKQ